MSASTFEELASHAGHRIDCVTYGDVANPANAAVECLDCGEVLMDFDREVEELEPLGEMGLPFGEVGSVVQSLAWVLVERGWDEAAVRSRLAAWGGEVELWDNLGDVVDRLAHQLDFYGEPGEEEEQED